MSKVKQAAGRFFVANPLLSVGIVAALGLTGYILVRRATKGKQRIPIVPAIPPIPKGEASNYTYIAQQYSDFADALADAMSGGGTDHDQIKNIMSKMKTKADVLALIDQYGKRVIKTPYFWDSDAMTLAQTFNYEMYPNEIDAYVNTPIKRTGYKF